jgi:penicillin amidase
MRTLRRLLLVLLAAASVLAQSSDLAARAKASLSQTSGTLNVAGLRAPVRVLRDRWGVPHIYARNQHDLFFAQGFVVAQDRLFQMELWKRTGQGRLAEVLGPAAVERDIYARLLQYRGDMDAEYASYAPDAREILTAFTDGINAYIASRHGDWPIEFQLAGFAPDAWRPEDCLNRMAAFSMASNAKRELANAQMVQTLGPEKAAALLDLDPPVNLSPPGGADYSGLSPRLLEQLVGSDVRIQFPAEEKKAAAADSRRSTRSDGQEQGKSVSIRDNSWPRSSALGDEEAPEVGSNNWTISGTLTATGKPILANDPHRTIAVPSLRYIVHLVAPGWDVIGATEPGLPGVAIGHNQRIGWGLTIFGIDQQDLYLETLNPQNPLQYKTESGWQTMRTERTVIQVKGAPNREVTLKFTRHGPVLWEDGQRALALRWVGAEPGSAGYLASLSLDRAQNWRQFLDAMKRWKLPSENMVYADVDGNIGEQSAGLAPIRTQEGNPWEGELPVPADRGYQWSGWVPLERQPHFFNPARGFIATANAKIVPEDYGERGDFAVVGHEWAPRDRVQRIEDVLNAARDAKRKLTVGDSQKLQGDVVSLPARRFLAMLSLFSTSKAVPLRRLISWDAALTAESPEASLYELWVNHLRTRTARAAGDGVQTPSVATTLRLLTNPPGLLFGADPQARRDDIVYNSFAEAEKQFAELNPDRTAWGALHTVTFRHPLDQKSGARELFDIGPVPRPGDGTTVCATAFGRGFEQASGASYREIFDLADWDRSLAVNTPGQSGQAGSPHYSDLVQMWAATDYFPLAYSHRAVERQAAETLVLRPAPPRRN